MSNDPQVTNQDRIDAMLERMDEVEKKFSPTMCTAKWLQSTSTLYNGHTHSCHHPSPHKIPLEELEHNPSALHNTNHKKIARQQMLDGKRPSECSYCWNIEDLPEKHISDRTYKSADPFWSTPFLDRIKKSSSDDIDPTYFEVAFDNTCNFKCSYCSPDVSSKWMEEVKQYGAYETETKIGDLDWLRKIGKMPISHKDYNPYIEAFWKWWTELYPKLETFRITGGEPLLSKHTWKVMEWISANPRDDLTFAINTNMGVPDNFIEKLITNYNEISPKIRQFTVFTSCEAHGRDAEYIRFGMDYSKFMDNVRKFLRETGDHSRIVFMVTFNAMSVPSFDKFLEDIFQMRCEFNLKDSENRIGMSISYLHWPPFQSARILPKEIKQEAAERLRKYVADRVKNVSPSEVGRFYLEEVDQVNRLCDFVLKDGVPELKKHQKDFRTFFKEYDRRRNTNFAETFPSLANFFNDV